MKNGYLVEYKKRVRFNLGMESDFTERRRKLVNRSQLARMITSKDFIVCNAFLVDMDEYRRNTEGNEV